MSLLGIAPPFQLLDLLVEADRITHEARGKEGGAPTGATGGLVRREVKGTAAQHGSGDTSHQGLRLDVEVSEHLVGAPATDHVETVAVDSGTKECHGTSSACRARRDVLVGRIRRIQIEGERGANAKRETPSGHILKRCGM